MKRGKVVGGFLSLSIFAFLSTPLLSEDLVNRQERLGMAIRDAAIAEKSQDIEKKGSAQERLGAAIRDVARPISKGEFQEQLGRLIRDSASLAYAQGALQEKMGTTIVSQALS